ncbi:MAG: DUF1007 family protein [Desulfovibrio sp.]
MYTLLVCMNILKRSALTGLLLLVLLFLKPVAGHAHPHIFIDCAVTAVFDEHGLTGFRQQWTFDEMFSMGMVQEYDADHDGTFDPQEADKYRKEIFSILTEYHYLTVLSVDGADQQPDRALDFQLSLRGGKLCYRFFTPCRVPYAATAHTVAITVFDEEYYADMALPLDACGTQGPAGLTVRRDHLAAPRLTYFGLIVPEFITYTFTTP